MFFTTSAKLQTIVKLFYVISVCSVTTCAIHAHLVCADLYGCSYKFFWMTGSNMLRVCSVTTIAICTYLVCADLYGCSYKFLWMTGSNMLRVFSITTIAIFAIYTWQVQIRTKIRHSKK